MTALYNGMSVPAGDLLAENSNSTPGFIQLTKAFAIPQHCQIHWSLAKQYGSYHKHGVQHRIPADLRAAAFAIAHPNYVVSGFAALALYGLPFFVDACDTVLMSDSLERAQPPSVYRPQLMRGAVPALLTWNVWCRKQRISIAAPPLAVVQALKVVRKETNGWKALTCGGYEQSFVRAVQLIDATRRHLDIDPLKVLEVSRNHLDLKWLTDVIVHSSALADSPKETEMRLIARRLAEKHGLILEEQVPVKKNGKYITRFDLALIDPRTGRKFGLMYDGAQHWEAPQRKRDAFANLEATAQDWTPLRFDSAALATMVSTLDDYFSRVLKR